jgi:hypothetical protein
MDNKGVHYGWVEQGFQKGYMIIFLDTPKWKRNCRILKRFFIEYLSFQTGNYKQSFTMLRKMYKWSNLFEKENKPEIISILVLYENKVIFLKDNSEIRKYIT